MLSDNFILIASMSNHFILPQSVIYLAKLSKTLFINICPSLVVYNLSNAESSYYVTNVLMIYPMSRNKNMDRTK